MTAGYFSDIKGRFIFIYTGMVITIIAALLFLNFTSLPLLALVLILLGLGGSLGGGAFSALMLNSFEIKVKEATAILGNLGIILGIVPSFLLPQIVGQKQLFILAIGITLVGILCLFIFQKLYYPKSR